MALFGRILMFFRGNSALTSRRFFETPGQETLQLGEDIKEEIKRLYGGAVLRIRTVDAGSTGAEEIELKMLTSAVYDMERFGLRFVASPRHADMLCVTGPVTRNMVRALRETYDATPQPCLVVAVGDGACTGGIWNGSYAIVGAVEKVIPVHAKIPGDPPTPEAILRGLLHILREART
jgi:Ni,Fe-hydrogenase III small subunit